MMASSGDYSGSMGYMSKSGDYQGLGYGGELEIPTEQELALDALDEEIYMDQQQDQQQQLDEETFHLGTGVRCCADADDRVYRAHGEGIFVCVTVNTAYHYSVLVPLFCMHVCTLIPCLACLLYLPAHSCPIPNRSPHHPLMSPLSTYTHTRT